MRPYLRDEPERLSLLRVVEKVGCDLRCTLYLPSGGLSEDLLYMPQLDIRRSHGGLKLVFVGDSGDFSRINERTLSCRASKKFSTHKGNFEHQTGCPTAVSD